jgi:gliding motility-associated-like protein
MSFVRVIFRFLFLFLGIIFLSGSILAQKPNWLPPNAALFNFNTNVTAVIKYDGVLTSALEDTIAIFVGDQIRGISVPSKIGNDLRHYITVYSSQTSEILKIKVYHALSNKVYDLNDSLIFIAQSPIGNYEKPYEINVFSSGDAPLSIDSISDKYTLQNIPFDTIDLPLFLNQPDTDLVTWSVSPHPDFVTNILEGKLLITPRNGFIGSGVIEIKATEQTINANYANQTIKLNVLKVPVRPRWDSIPGQAILKGNSFKSFLLSDYENKYEGECLTFDYLPVLPEIIDPEPSPQWVVQQTFLNSMTFIARPVYTPTLPFNHPDDLLAAYIDGNLHGVAERQVINGQILYFLGVGSQQSVGVITFHFYSGALKRKFIAPIKIPYITSAIRGSFEIPYEINLSPIQPIIDSNSLVQLQIIDSAWVGKIDFRFQAKDCSYSILSAAARSLLETFTYVPFWVTSNNADLFTFYKDYDGDGFGDPNVSQTIANGNPPPNYVTNNLDCDDSDDAVNPSPSIAAVQDVSLCFGMLTDSILFKRGSNGIKSPSSKTIYKWTNNNTAIGLAASGTGNILPFLTKNIKSRNDTAQIIVTPEINGCLGIKDTFLLIVRAEALSTYYKDDDGDGFGNPAVSITICDMIAPVNYVSNKLDCDDSDDAVNPSPSIATVQDKSYCIGMLTDSIVFKRGSNGINSPSSKTIYKWINNNPAIGLAASGNGNIAPFFTTNIKSRNDTAQIIVTPEINGCLGIKDTFLVIVRNEALSTYYKDEDGDGFGNPAISVTICDLNAPANYVSNKLDCDDSDNTIKPYPTLTSVQDNSFCIGVLTDSIVFTRTVNGMVVNSNKISYKWINNNPAIGLAASGNGKIAPFFTTNTKSKNDTAQIIVTPEINGCLGIKDTFFLIVKADSLPRVSSLNCSSFSILSMVLPNANDLYQNTLRLPYAGGNGMRYDSMTIKSEGVLGLTMKLKQGTLARGDGFLEFELSGVPLQGGSAKFIIDFGRGDCHFGPPCEIKLEVGIEKPKLNSLLCSQVVFLPGKIYAKVPYYGKIDLPYLGGNEKLAPTQLFQSEGIRGLTAKFNADTLRRNGGLLRFNLDGMPEQTGTLNLTVEIGGKSCVLNLLIEEFPVVLPKFFSPNGDGNNERWEIPYFNILYPQGTVIILDRYGRKLLEYKGNFEGWDGNIGGFAASTGVYWYIVQLEKDAQPIKGNFTLVR